MTREVSTELSFKSVCELIKEEDSQLIEAADKLLGAVLVLSPIALGPAALPALGLLGVKDQLVKIAKSVYSNITKKADGDLVTRQQRMERLCP
jgi:hypothetical protein